MYHGKEDIYPLVYYYIAYGYENLHGKENTEQANCYMTMYDIGRKCCSGWLLSSQNGRLYRVKESGRRISSGHGLYYLGCLLYDRRVYDESIEDYEESILRSPDFPTVQESGTGILQCEKAAAESVRGNGERLLHWMRRMPECIWNWIS